MDTGPLCTTVRGAPITGMRCQWQARLGPHVSGNTNTGAANDAVSSTIPSAKGILDTYVNANNTPRPTPTPTVTPARAPLPPQRTNAVGSGVPKSQSAGSGAKNYCSVSEKMAWGDQRKKMVGHITNFIFKLFSLIHSYEKITHKECNQL